MKLSNQNDLKKFLMEKRFNKIFVLTGKKSFKISGAIKYSIKFLKKKKHFIILKKVIFQN